MELLLETRQSSCHTVGLSVVLALYVVFAASQAHADKLSRPLSSTLSATPDGAEELGTFDSWAVFQYPRDPWHKCYVGGVAFGLADHGNARLLVDVGAGEVSITREPGFGYASPDEGPDKFSVTVGSQSFSYLYEPFSSSTMGADEVSGDDMIQVMKGSEAANSSAEVIVQGETWRSTRTSDTFTLQGFTTAHDAAMTSLCHSRRTAGETGNPVMASMSSAERPAEHEGRPYAKWRLTGPFFETGTTEELMLTATPMEDGEESVGIIAGYLENANLAYYRDGLLIGSDWLGWLVRLAEICVSPESGRLELILTSTAGGSSGWTDSYFVFYEPHTGRMASAWRGLHGEEIYDQLPGVEEGTFVPPLCPFRRRGAAVESFAQELLSAAFFNGFDWGPGQLYEPDKPDELYKLEGAALIPFNRAFRDDVLSGYLRLIREAGPDSPLIYQRFDSIKFSVVTAAYSGYGRDAFQMIFVKAVDDDWWRPIYHAGRDNELERAKLAQVRGFVNEQTLRIYMCVRSCVRWEHGQYGEVNLNLRTLKAAMAGVD